MSLEKVCVVCGKTFVVSPSREQSARTCSRSCRGVIDAGRHKTARAELTCKACGNKFSSPQSQASRRVYCSDACADPLRKPVVLGGETHHWWKGGTTHSSDGYLYVRIPDHPYAQACGYIFEHRVIVEAWMREAAPGHRFLIVVEGVAHLRPGIDVHHINFNKRDNRRFNLLACTQAAHRDIHNGHAPMCGEVWPEINGLVPYEPRKVVRTCNVCGAEFLKKRSDVKRGAGKYCSRDCYNNRVRDSFAIDFKI